MSMIRVDNLTFAYPASYENVFENVSFQIDTDWKLGFIGRNGRGKTTFLNLLLGKYDYKGKIHSSVQFNYFPYPVKDKGRITQDILSDICPIAQDWEILRELSYLEVNEELLYRPFNTLSNGEQTKVLLAALFLNEGHFLLIDEPTNHLDVHGREIVANYLQEKKSFILVSHDRNFLDRCIDHDLSINRSNITVQGGNFSTWFINFEQQQDFEFMQHQKLSKEIEHMKHAARQTKAWSDAKERSKNGIKTDKGYIGHKAAKMMKRSKAIEKRQERAIEEKSVFLKNVEVEENLKITPLPYHSDKFAVFSDVSLIFNEKRVCKPVSFEIMQGDRIALDGKNGSGKTSLMKILVGNSIQHDGIITIGSGLKISYVPQDTSFLEGNLSDFSKLKDIDESVFKAILRKMDFSRIQFDKNMKDFSEGQKKKVLLASSLCQKANLYLWDEPLNYIDIYSRIQIENLIKEYLPTMLFVEHDLSFREKIATRTIQLERL